MEKLVGIRDYQAQSWELGAGSWEPGAHCWESCHTPYETMKVNCVHVSLLADGGQTGEGCESRRRGSVRDECDALVLSVP